MSTGPCGARVRQTRGIAMNILDILILVVLAFSICAGLYKGFLSSLLATLGLVGSWFGAQAVYQRVADIALNNRTLLAALTNYLEPETFLPDGGTTLVSALGGNAAQIQTVVDAASKKVPFIKGAMQNNLLNQAFADLNLNTVAEYFSQTLWEAVFHVLAFIICFVVIYLLVLLVLNLLDHVFRFPELRTLDWLLGGLLGLVRGLAFAMLIMVIALPLLNVVAPEFTQELQAGSQLYSFVSSFDFLDITKTISRLAGA